MKSHTPFLAVSVFAAILMSSSVGHAQSYGTELAQGFVDWCTVKQSQPATVCSCAVSKAAIEIPATAMASFLAAPEGAATATVGSGVGATALQIISTCAVGGASAPSTGGSTLGGSLNSLGGFGK